MAWDPTVLRKYNATGHFRLLNQLRGELKSNPLVRPKDGERVGDVNRSRALVRAIEARAGAGPSRSRRAAAQPVVVLESLPDPIEAGDETQQAASFRDRLNTVDLR